MRRVLEVAPGAAIAAVVVRGWTRVLPTALPDRLRTSWERTNHSGRTVSLVEGPIALAGCGVLAAGAPAAGIAGVAAGLLGMLDDLRGDASNKGLRGHLAALRRGEITTGAVKVVGIGAVGLATAIATDRRCAPATLMGAGVVAGCANLINLFDLRPGRALKVVGLLGVPLLPGGGFGEGALLGTTVALLPEDLRGERMLGDTGANALGAALGGLLLTRAGGMGRTVALAALTTLTLASERVSFTQIIAEHDVLRAVDEWGRGGL